MEKVSRDKLLELANDYRQGKIELVSQHLGLDFEIDKNKDAKLIHSDLKRLDIRDAGILTTTGINELDKCLGGGVALGELLIYAGVPGIGKTIFMSKTASENYQIGKKVAYFTNEMPTRDIARIVDCHITHYNSLEIRRQRGYTEEQKKIITQALYDCDIMGGKIVYIPLAVTDTTAKIIEELQLDDYDVFILDHLLRVWPMKGSYRSKHDWQSVSEVMEELKQIVKDFMLHGFAACHCTAASEQKEELSFEDLAEAKIGVSGNADGVAAIIRTESLRKQLYAKIQLLKSRYGYIEDSVIIPCDFSTMTIGEDDGSGTGNSITWD